MGNMMINTVIVKGLDYVIHLIAKTLEKGNYVRPITPPVQPPAPPPNESPIMQVWLQQQAQRNLDAVLAARKAAADKKDEDG